MKKFICFTLAVAAIAAMVSCSSEASSAGKAAKRYAEYIADGNYDKFVDGIYIPEGTPAEEVEQGKTMLKSMLAEKGESSIEEKGGMKSVEIVSEEIAPDGKTATVTMLYTYGNGETSEEDMDMILDGGKWKIDMDK